MNPMPETAILKCLANKNSRKNTDMRHPASVASAIHPGGSRSTATGKGVLTRQLLDGLCSMVPGKVELAPPGCLRIYPFCSSSAKIQDHNYKYDSQPKE